MVCMGAESGLGGVGLAGCRLYGAHLLPGKYTPPPSVPHTFILRLLFWFWFWFWLWFYHWFWFWFWLWLWLRGRLGGHLYFLYYFLLYGYTTCSGSPRERKGGAMVNGSK